MWQGTPKLEEYLDGHVAVVHLKYGQCIWHVTKQYFYAEFRVVMTANQQKHDQIWATLQNAL